MVPETVAYCGVDCAVCPDYTQKTCPGCRNTEWPEGDACMPVACCRRRGIPWCAACGEFPCTEMRGFYEESDGHRAALERMRRAAADAVKQTNERL